MAFGLLFLETVIGQKKNVRWKTHDHLVVKTKGLYWGWENQTGDISLTDSVKCCSFPERVFCIWYISISQPVGSDGKEVSPQWVWVPLAQLADLEITLVNTLPYRAQEFTSNHFSIYYHIVDQFVWNSNTCTNWNPDVLRVLLDFF